MSAKSQPKEKPGKHYESSTHQVLTKLNPTKSVMADVRIKGKLSRGRGRQIDVKIGDYDFIMFECKDLTRKVGVQVVEQVVGMLEDVGAREAAIVSNSGFTKEAMNYAEGKNVQLLAVVDTGDPAIRTAIASNCLVEDRGITGAAFGISSMSTRPWRAQQDLQNQPVRTPEGGITTTYGLLRDLWNKGEIPDEAGEHEVTLDEVVLVTDGIDYTIDHLTIRYVVGIELFVYEVGMESAEGIYDVRKRTFTTRGPITTDEIHFEDIPKNGIRVASREEAMAKYTINMGLGLKSDLPDKP